MGCAVPWLHPGCVGRVVGLPDKTHGLLDRTFERKLFFEQRDQTVGSSGDRGKAQATRDTGKVAWCNSRQA